MVFIYQQAISLNEDFEPYSRLTYIFEYAILEKNILTPYIQVVRHDGPS